MIGKNMTSITKVLLAMGLVAGAVLIGAACTREKEVEVTREVPVEVTVEVLVDVPMNLAETAAGIRAGDIDVGDEFGMAIGQRYHTIHAETLGLVCAACHVSEPDTIQTVFGAQDVSPISPGSVDRRGCVGCHSAAGPAQQLYGE